MLHVQSIVAGGVVFCGYNGSNMCLAWHYYQVCASTAGVCFAVLGCGLLAYPCNYISKRLNSRLRVGGCVCT